MKRSVLAAGAVALAATLSTAHAEEIIGRIAKVDDTAHRVTLTDGRTYTLATLPGASYFAAFNDNLRVGDKIRLVEVGGVVTGISSQ